MSSPLELLSDPAHWALLQELQQQDPDLTSLNQQLRRRGLAPELATALTAQLDLRRHARTKFGQLAQRMLFTRAGLEQASRLPVARWHARRFAAAGIERVADLGCGIGTESLALALEGIEVWAIDLDPEAAACASRNLSDFAGARVEQRDLTELTAEDLRGWGVFLDPARRGPTGRRFRPEDWAPSWDHIRQMCSWNIPLGVKVAPGIDYSYLPSDHSAQWVSVDGDLVEASLWSPSLSPEGPGRGAVLFDSDGEAHLLSDPAIASADAPTRQAEAGPLDAYLFEPDPAVIRSGMIARLCELTGTHLVSPSIAYMTGPEPVDSPFLTGFRVLAQTPLRVKAIRAALREMDAGHVEVKKRGADIDPAALQKQLQGPGSHNVVVIATRVGAAHRAIIATRHT